jgi:hypothetical protein
MLERGVREFPMFRVEWHSHSPFQQQNGQSVTDGIAANMFMRNDSSQIEKCQLQCAQRGQ